EFLQGPLDRRHNLRRRWKIIDVKVLHHAYANSTDVFCLLLNRLAGKRLKGHHIFGDGSRDDSDVIQRRSERKDTAKRQISIGGLHADDAAESCRIPDGAARISANR